MNLSVEKADACRNMVREFHAAFQLNAPIETWKTLMEEEAEELCEAIDEDDGSIESSAQRLKETCDLMYVTLGFQVAAEKLQDMMVTLSRDALMTVSAAVAEAMQDFGQDEFFEAFQRVHQSNMSKLQDDGTPLRREDGKVLKGPNYAPPYLNDLV